MRINRPIANTTDQVRVNLLVGAENYLKEIVLNAWLVLPDGTERSLPAMQPGLAFLYAGAATNLELSLLNREFSDLGVGTYRVRVRLLDREEGTPRHG